MAGERVGDWEKSEEVFVVTSGMRLSVRDVSETLVAEVPQYRGSSKPKEIFEGVAVVGLFNVAETARIKTGGNPGYYDLPQACIQSIDLPGKQAIVHRRVSCISFDSTNGSSTDGLRTRRTISISAKS